MKSKNQILFLSVILCSFLFIAGIPPEEKKLLKPFTNDDYNFIAINEIMMWVANNGDGSHDPETDGSGFYWPGGKSAKKAAIFEDGLIWGCIVGGDTLVNGNTHRQGLQAGKILPDGTADDPDNPRYRVYKIQKDWEDLQPGPERDSYEKDYNEWPVEDGAPWVDIDGDGNYISGIDQPEFPGNQVLWYIANDLNEEKSMGTFGSSSIGLEFQTTVFGINQTNFLNDVIFKKYLIINKSEIQLDSMYFGYWSDDDLGSATDDFVGCDTLLNLGYTYNADNEDGTGSGITYGTDPRAVGHMFVQGPYVPALASDSARFRDKWVSGYKNQNMTAFTFYSSDWGSLCPVCYPWNEAVPMYHRLMGLNWNGNPFINPFTGAQTKYLVPGNAGAYPGGGWHCLNWPDSGINPADMRYIISSGPFTMAPGDSQEVVIAILIARGNDYLDSIHELKKKSELAQYAYDINFKSTPVIEGPALEAVPEDKKVRLYWEANTEDFNVADKYLEKMGLYDPYYLFEGYRIWQFRDTTGTDPRLLATFDLENSVDIIYDQRIINGHPAIVVAIDGPNEGIRRSFSVFETCYDKKPLNNANPYYFGVTAYAYSEHSDPSFVESEPEIIEIIPGLKKIDQTYSHDAGDKIVANRISGNGDGSVELIVVDPDALTGDEYRVMFEGEGEDASYSFVNYTTSDTIISDCTNFLINIVKAKIIDGFILNVDNQGWKEIYYNNPDRNYAIKDIIEINGPDGIDLEPPISVFRTTNSTGVWEITTYGMEPDSKQNIDVNDQIGFHNYEIRYTSTGSDYYLTGLSPGFQPWRADDPKADNHVPFEIWDIGMTDFETDDFRLSIKTLDDYVSLVYDSNYVDQDGKWSRLENGDWEPIFAFFQDSTYTEPLSETSGRITNVMDSRLGKITWKPLTSEDVFSVIATAPNTKDYASAKTSLDDISVFPNPFFGFGTLSGYLKQDFMRFTNVPVQVTVRIEKNDDNPWLDWDLKNNAGQQVASGVYIAHLEMPNIGEKVMKLAVILEEQR